MLENLIQLDQAFFYLINRGTQNVVFDILMPVISWEYLWVLPGLISVYFLIKSSRKIRLIIIAIFFVFIINDALNSRLLKPVFSRPRPHAALSEVHQYKKGWVITPEKPAGKKRSANSFPSSHAANAAAVALMVGYFFTRFWPWGAAAASLIGFSRIYVGAHYPADVLAGFIVGLSISGILIYTLRTLALKIPSRFDWVINEAPEK